MKKETINTFEGGLIKDLHPLTTPNNVLTDALNATLITYNGNENILLNDMGNSKIDNAFLPKGYVPVGMKEHGGIVYVAAYNPKTGKGQVGSFPSPQQLWEGDDWSVNAPESFEEAPDIGAEVYDGNYIVKEIVKKELFVNSNSGKARIFHPGDKFAIVIDNNAFTSLSAAINNDYLDILLGVVKSDGSIEIMRTWSKDSPNTIFILDNDNNPSNNNAKASNALENNSKVNVFDCSSSGQLIIILNMHTFDTFNLIRKYSMVKVNGQDKVMVTFTGEATKGNLVLSSTITGSGLKLSMNGTSDLLSIPVTEGSSPQPPYTIYPNTDFGIVKRMGKTINIDFTKIRKDEESFGEWRFFVTDTYIKIGWSYDFYNLDGTKEIKYIRMYFHKLEDGYNRGTAKHYDLQKEYYNGNFEDYINILEALLSPKNVYIVEIVKIVTDNTTNQDSEEIICFKMLYLSKLYNGMYNNFFTNNSIGVDGELSSVPNSEYTLANPMTVKLDLNAEFNTNLTASKATIKTPGDNNYSNEVDSTQVLQSTYVKEMTVDEFEAIQGSKLFITKVKNSYSGNIALKAEFADVDDELIGTPDPGIINYVLSNTSLVNSSIAYDLLEWLKTSNMYTPGNYGNEYLDITVLSASTNNNIKAFPFTAQDMRVIEGKSSEVLDANYESKGLKPLYSPDYTADKKSRVAPYWKLDEMLVMSGDADEKETIFYNSTLSHDGSVMEGPDAGGGIDDGGLRTASSRMNNPMTNIFVGMNGDAAEMSFKRLAKNGGPATAMDLTDNSTPGGGQVIIDLSDNYAIACWKFTDGNTRFVNLITKKDGTKTLNNTKVLKTARDAWPRVDVMLRCILSLLFLVNRITKTAKYITTDPYNYAYLTGNTNISLEALYGGSLNITDIMGRVVNDNFKSLKSYLTDSNIWNYNNGKLHLTINGTALEFPMVNLIPEVSLTLPFSSNKLDLTYTIPNYYDLDILLGNYTGVSYTSYINDSSNLDIGAIYSIDTSQTNKNTEACANSSLLPMLDGAFKWNSTPAYKKVTGDLSVYRWNNNNIITFPEFGLRFTTRAKMEEWLDIPEDGLENEVLAVIGESTEGTWTNAATEAAPDISYKTLYSSELSLYENELNLPILL